MRIAAAGSVLQKWAFPSLIRITNPPPEKKSKDFVLKKGRSKDYTVSATFDPECGEMKLVLSNNSKLIE